MKSQKLIKRKKLKARNRRKDFSQKRNVRRNNWPTPIEKEVVPILRSARDENGKMDFKDGKSRYKVVGEKIVFRKVNKQFLSHGDGFLPKGKKFKGRKEKNVI